MKRTVMEATRSVAKPNLVTHRVSYRMKAQVAAPRQSAGRPR